MGWERREWKLVGVWLLQKVILCRWWRILGRRKKRRKRRQEGKRKVTCTRVTARVTQMDDLSEYTFSPLHVWPWTWPWPSRSGAFYSETRQICICTAMQRNRIEVHRVCVYKEEPRFNFRNWKFPLCSDSGLLHIHNIYIYFFSFMSLSGFYICYFFRICIDMQCAFLFL